MHAPRDNIIFTSDAVISVFVYNWGLSGHNVVIHFIHTLPLNTVVGQFLVAHVGEALMLQSGTSLKQNLLQLNYLMNCTLYCYIVCDKGFKYV